MGFWVAMSSIGSGSGCRSPSTVTAPSSIASISADWVRGEVRFSSSTSTTWPKTGPGTNVKRPAAASQTPLPVISPAVRSGVAWIRRKLPSTQRASARASRVFPVPGTSSTSRWPPATSTVTAVATASGTPRTARSTSATIARAAIVAAARAGGLPGGAGGGRGAVRVTRPVSARDHPIMTPGCHVSRVTFGACGCP